MLSKITDLSLVAAELESSGFFPADFIAESTDSEGVGAQPLSRIAGSSLVSATFIATSADSQGVNEETSEPGLASIISDPRHHHSDSQSRHTEPTKGGTVVTELEETSQLTGGMLATSQDGTHIIEPAILNELCSQQKYRFFDFRQWRVPFKLQTAFVASAKTYRQDFPPEPANYRQLAGHAFEKEFCDCMDDQIRQHREQFRSWEVVSSKEATGH